MLNYVWISLGGAIGTAARFCLSGACRRNARPNIFSYGTLAVNVTGSLIIGMFAALTEPDGHWLVSPSFRQFFHDRDLAAVIYNFLRHP